MTSYGINSCVYSCNRIFVSVISLVQKLLQTYVACRTFARIVEELLIIYVLYLLKLWLKMQLVLRYL